MEDFATFMKHHPHNTDCGDRFMELVNLCYSMDMSGRTLEEFVEMCISAYGGTVAGAMISYLKNHI